jgi:hypothetical protein
MSPKPKTPPKLTYPQKTAAGRNAEIAAGITAEPGSRAFNESQPAALRVPDAQTSEGIAERNASTLMPTPGLKLISDEWYGQIEMGNPFQETGKPYADANPDKHFRFLGDSMTKGRGKRGYQVFNDPQTGKPVVVAGMTLAFIPMAVKEEKDRRLSEKTNLLRKQTREQYEEATRKLQKDSGGQLQALDGKITETVGHQRAEI